MELQYCLPPGFISGITSHSCQIARLGASLRGVDSRLGARVPGTPLNIRLLLMLNGASIEFDYDNELAYVNFCCFQAKHADDVFDVVEHFYRQYKIGKPRRPILDKWIHLVPVAGPMPDLRYSILSQQLAVSFFWAAYWQQFNSALRN
ncbi:MAG TPA: hypothetical protein VFE32_21465 [Puia sp.]|nr:hypothetical protein [Puia sp.]